ncbi:polysaccharide biosynthesis/export family protein [Phenylobacterium sp. VNQ135]|uniref:polysaccharide biosynthesis/export family protein n=1 Tax=Phenylobacterium sp. VNQ135 TaxID=3400922 RepID=UPI003C07EAB7
MASGKLKRVVAVVLGAAIVSSGCATPPQTGDNPPLSALVDETWRAEDFEYRIGAGDELGVRFLVNPDLNAQVTVGPDGSAVFPLISSVKLSGLTVRQADAKLSQIYAGVLRNPQVNTLIYNYAAGQVYVGGEVREPGARNIRGEMTAIQAIMESGGFLDTARTRKIVVLRKRTGDTRVLMRTFDANAALRGADGSDLRLLPGDVVFVPRSAVAEVNRIVRQYITNSLPFSMNYELSRDVP